MPKKDILNNIFNKKIDCSEDSSCDSSGSFPIEIPGGKCSPSQKVIINYGEGGIVEVGNIIQGDNIVLSGNTVGRLVGIGDITISAIIPDLSVSWEDITGDQSVIGNSGFTNDAEYITLNDLPVPIIPNLQEVTDVGNISTNSIFLQRPNNDISIGEVSSDPVFAGPSDFLPSSKELIQFIDGDDSLRMGLIVPERGQIGGFITKGTSTILLGHANDSNIHLITDGSLYLSAQDIFLSPSSRIVTLRNHELDFTDVNDASDKNWKLQDKSGIIALLDDIPDMGDYLPLSGGTMSGDINMGGNSLNNIYELTVPSGSSTSDGLVRIQNIGGSNEHSVPQIEFVHGGNRRGAITGNTSGGNQFGLGFITNRATDGSSTPTYKMRLFEADNSANPNINVGRFYGSVTGRMDGTSDPNGYESQFITQNYLTSQMGAYLPLIGNTSSNPITGGVVVASLINGNYLAISNPTGINGMPQLTFRGTNSTGTREVWHAIANNLANNTDMIFRTRTSDDPNASSVATPKLAIKQGDNGVEEGDLNLTVAQFYGSVLGRMPTSVGNGSGYAGTFVTKPYVDVNIGNKLSLSANSTSPFTANPGINLNTITGSFFAGVTGTGLPNSLTQGAVLSGSAGVGNPYTMQLFSTGGDNFYYRGSQSEPFLQVASRTYVDEQSVIEALDEGNGIGYRIRGRNPDNYGDIGLGAFDVSFSDGASSTRGASGEYSFASGYNNSALQPYSFISGDNNASNEYATFISGSYNSVNSYGAAAIGINNTVNGAASVSFGANNITSNDFAVSFGNYNQSNGASSGTMGYSLKANAFGSLSIGAFNDPIVSPEVSFTPGSPVFIAGNGTTIGSESNAYVLYNNGNSWQSGRAVVNGMTSNDDILVVGDAQIVGTVTSDEVVAATGIETVDFRASNATLSNALNADIVTANDISAATSVSTIALDVAGNTTASGHVTITPSTTTSPSAVASSLRLMRNVDGVFIQGRRANNTNSFTLRGYVDSNGAQLTLSDGGITASGPSIINGTLDVNGANFTVIPNITTSPTTGAHKLLYYRQAGQLSGSLRAFDENSASSWILRSYTAAGNQFTLEKGGIAANGAYTNTSDIRIKDTVEYNYSAVDSLRAITFAYKDNRDSGRVHVGYSAQEVQEVLPDAVYVQTDEDGNEIEDGLLSVDHVQVLIAKLELLQQQVKYLQQLLN